MGSIAMDRAGNMALGYSVSDATVTFPACATPDGFVTDAAGSMPQGEGTFVNGVGLQTTTNNRWGDYAWMNVDPVDDCIVLVHQRVLPTTSATGWMLRVGSPPLPGAAVRAGAGRAAVLRDQGLTLA